MLDILTLIIEQNRMACIILCTISPKYSWANVVYSMRNRNFSLPWIAPMDSTRNNETKPAIGAKVRNAADGLHMRLNQLCVN